MSSKNLFLSNLRGLLLVVSAILLFGASVLARQDENKPKPRDIVPVFETMRPPGSAAGNVEGSPPGSSNPNRKPKSPPYQRISSRINSGKIANKDRPGKRPPKQNQTNIAENRARQIGVTLWRLNEVRPSANLETLFESINGKRRYLMPERVSIDTLFESYDMVRFAVESSKRGYLYVVDQEMYADGTLGDAYLVFPNRRIRSGANLIAPGKPVELPDPKGNPFYFELRPENQSGKVLAAEILTVIITDQEIPNLKIGEQPLLIDEKTLVGWRGKWSGRVEIFEPNAGSKTYTKREREAADGNRILTGDDPLPQTVFLVEANRNAGALITVPLWYGRN